MKINGIGNVKQSDVLSVLSEDGKQALKDGTLTQAEAAQIYKLEMIKRASKIGRFEDTFSAIYNRIPAEIEDRLTPGEIAALIDAIYYSKL